MSQETEVAFGENIDSFDNKEPILEGDVKEKAASSDTFKDYDEDESESSGKENKEEVKESKPEIDPDSDVNNLDDQEDDGEDKDSSKKKEGDEDEQEDSKKTSEEIVQKSEESVTDKKMIVGKVGDEKFKIDPDIIIPVKVAGKSEQVTLQELRDNYAGKVVWDKKFSEVEKKNVELVSKEQNLKSQIEKIGGRFKELGDILNDETKNPFDALYYLLDISGHDPYDFYKRSIETQLEQFEQLMEMSEVERKLFFNEKKLEFIGKRDESLKKRSQEEQAQAELLKQVDQIREAHGVSEDDYVDAFEDLSKAFDKNKLTPKQVVSWALVKPHMAKAEEIVMSYKAHLNPESVDKLISEVAITMRDNPEISIDDIKEMVEDELGVGKSLKELEKKVIKRKSDDDYEKPSKKSDDLELFD